MAHSGRCLRKIRFPFGSLYTKQTTAAAAAAVVLVDVYIHIYIQCMMRYTRYEVYIIVWVRCGLLLSIWLGNERRMQQGGGVGPQNPFVYIYIYDATEISRRVSEINPLRDRPPHVLIMVVPITIITRRDLFNHHHHHLQSLINYTI